MRMTPEEYDKLVGDRAEAKERVVVKKAKADYASAIETHCKMIGLPVPVAEFKFWPERPRTAFDFAWPDKRVALEVEGIVYPKEKGDYRAGGRHASVSGFKRDIDKYAQAFTMGWRVLRVLPEHVHNGQALLWAEPMLRRTP